MEKMKDRSAFFGEERRLSVSRTTLIFYNNTRGVVGGR